MCGQRRLILLLAIILSVGSQAAEIKLAPGTWRGTATVTVVVAADGTQTITVDATQPITITGGGTTGPVPPVDPPPAGTPLDKFRVSVRKATAEVVDQNKAASQAAIAKLYASLSGMPVNSRDQLVQATDAMWGLLPLPDTWWKWRSNVDIGLQPFQTLDDARKAWMAVSEGVAP